MGNGGATWDTAGTLTLGGDNTFAVADADAGSAGEYSPAWWTYTPTVAAQVTIHTAFSIFGDPGFADTVLDVFTGDDEGAAVNIESDDDTYGGFSQVVFAVTAGVTYHIRVTSLWDAGDTSITTYVLTVSSHTYTYGPWIDDLQNNPDNHLIVTAGDLRLANPNPFFSGPAFSRPSWMEQVVRGGQGRRGDYAADETLGGDPVSGALSCVIEHADNGDQGHQAWNATGTGISPTTPAICVPLFPRGTNCDVDTLRSHTGYNAEVTEGLPLVAAEAIAAAAGPSYGMWFLPVRDNLTQSGVLNGPLDPTDYGAPEDAELFYESPTVGLLGVDLADGDPLPLGTAPFVNKWVLNDPIGPTWEAGTTSVWRHGKVGVPPGGTPPPEHPWLTFEYEDGNDDAADIEWHEIPGMSDWDGHGWTEDYESGATDPETSDVGVVVAWPAAVVEGDEERFARLAVRFRLQPPRFRYRWLADTLPPVTRQWPRSPDARGLSAGTRIFPTPKSGRLFGGEQ